MKFKKYANTRKEAIVESDSKLDEIFPNVYEKYTADLPATESFDIPKKDEKKEDKKGPGRPKKTEE